MLMNKLLRYINIFLILFFLFLPTSHAQGKLLPPEPPEEHYYKAQVIEVIKEENKKVDGSINYVQTVKLEIEDGPEKGKSVTIDHGGVVRVDSSQKLKVGETVVLIKTILPDKTNYTVLDRYRIDTLLYIVAGFFLLVIFVAGKKGLGSILGMIVSVLIILQFIVPQILRGQDPLLITIAGSLAIMVITIYLAHGISRRTTVALASTAGSLLITGILAFLFVEITSLSGVGTEDAYLLQFGPTSINLKGLLLGGIIIGTLGVLDDITTSQAAAVFEISRANKKLEFMDLVTRGYVVGKEHIAALVNTLVLAYAGASLSLFILFVLNPSNQPYWVILNSQVIVEEVIRTLAGSIGLVLAVPISTVLSAWVALKWRE